MIFVFQVVSWVGSGESMLLASFRIPKCLEEAEQLKKEHEQFQEDIEVGIFDIMLLAVVVCRFAKRVFNYLSLSQRTHTAAVQIKHRAESLISMNHFDLGSIREIAQEVTKRWQQLVTCTEERHKLVTASVNFYKTAEQVTLFDSDFW